MTLRVATIESRCEAARPRAPRVTTSVLSAVIAAALALPGVALASAEDKPATPPAAKPAEPAKPAAKAGSKSKAKAEAKTPPADTPAPPAPPTEVVIPAGTAPGLIPQPDGPVPPGKVWSPEHGHWHDLPPDGSPQVITLGADGTSATGGIQVQAAPAPLPGGLTPQPEGPVPPGKVWSPEHGHWHDAPGATPQAITLSPGQAGAAGGLQIMPATPGQPGAPGAPAMVPITPATGQLTPQPDGPVPPGKVWSPEHGHWHDAPGAAPQQVVIPATPASAPPAPPVSPAPGQLTPQPDGPVPPGKVWSPEHGHWHDAPPAPTPAPPAPPAPEAKPPAPEAKPSAPEAKPSAPEAKKPSAPAPKPALPR